MCRACCRRVSGTSRNALSAGLALSCQLRPAEETQTLCLLETRVHRPALAKLQRLAQLWTPNQSALFEKALDHVSTPGRLRNCFKISVTSLASACTRSCMHLSRSLNLLALH